MNKLFSVIFIAAVGCSLVSVMRSIQAQSATANATLDEIKKFEQQTTNALTKQFNSLRDDVYGHFYRSQNTLRIARQSLFSTASKFSYHQLTAETRPILTARLTAIITEIIDPTVDYLQKDSMLRYYNFMKDASTPIEKGLQPIMNQLEESKTTARDALNENCLKQESVTARKLSKDYEAAVDAVSDCIKNATASYRMPINEFTRVHFIALPFIARINQDLNQCSNADDSVLTRTSSEDCAMNFLKKYCEGESCKLNSVITAVKTQAETMVNTVQASFEECQKAAASPKLLPIRPLNKCVSNKV